MNVVRNTVNWFISDTVSTRNSKRLMQEIVPSHYTDADTIGLCFRGPSYLVFMRGGHTPEIWWREDGGWRWGPTSDVDHLWGVEHECS